MPRTNEPGRSVASRLLEVLFAFEPEHASLTLAELVRRTGIPHATTRRLVCELVESGALDQDARGRLTVGVRLWELATLTPGTESLRRAAQPLMDELYESIRQHVQLVILDGREGLIVERRSTPRAIGLVSRVGGRLPLHASAGGKVLLSHADPLLIDSVLRGPLPKFTAKTITDPVQLRRQIASANWTGTATVREELTLGADSVATRITGTGGRVVAALSVVVQVGSVELQALVPQLMETALGISRQFARLDRALKRSL